MAGIHGKDGKVTLASATILDITEWSMDNNADVKEDTAFSGDDLPARTYVRGLVGSTGKLTGNLNMADTTGQLALWTSLSSDTPLAGSFYIDDTHFFAGNFFITKFSPKVNVDDIESTEFDFQMTGAVSFT